MISLGALLSMSHIPKPEVQIDEPVMTSLKSGLKYAVSRQELVGTYVVDFVAMIFGMPNASFPAIAQSYGGAKALGMLFSAPAVGVACRRFSCRVSVIFGSVILFIGLTSSAFVPSLELLYFTYGIVAGNYIFAVLHAHQNFLGR